MSIKILIAAGGTGGHLFPAQQLAKKLEGKCTLCIAGHNVQQSPFFRSQILCKNIAAATFRRKNPFHFAMTTFKGFFQALRILMQFSPDVVVGFGSYHSFPLLLAATLLRKKLVLYEANCVLGKVNQFFSSIAHTIGLQFPLSTPLKRSVITGLNVRPGSEILRKEALAYFGLQEGIPVILIFGGSQGAQFLNQVAAQAIQDHNVQCIHLTGKGHTVINVKGCVKEFEEKMDFAYAASDFAICRSGASTIAELIHYQKPAILIPFPFATEQHQLKNAQFFVHQVGGGKLLIQGQTSALNLSEEIAFLLQNLSQYQKNLQAYCLQSYESLEKIVLRAAQK